MSFVVLLPLLGGVSIASVLIATPAILEIGRRQGIAIRDAELLESMRVAARVQAEAVVLRLGRPQVARRSTLALPVVPSPRSAEPRREGWLDRLAEATLPGLMCRPQETVNELARRYCYVGRRAETIGTVAQRRHSRAAEQRQVHEAWNRPTGEWPVLDDATLDLWRAGLDTMEVAR